MTDRTPTLSIITPVLNGAMHLARAMRSVREAADRGASIEHIIADGGSTDGSLDLAAAERGRAGSPITRILTGPDRGQSHAINRGFAEVRGTYFTWLNADDYYIPSGLAEVAGRLSRSKADVVTGLSRFVNEKDVSLFAPRAPDPMTPESLLRLLTGWFAGRSIAQPEAFIRSDAFRRAGGLDESLHLTMDYHLWLRLASAGAAFEHVPIDVARQLVHAGQKTADNASVVAEMLRYGPSFLSQRSPSSERDRAEQELARVQARLASAKRLQAEIDRMVSSARHHALLSQPVYPIDDALLRKLRLMAPPRPRLLLAGLSRADIDRVSASLNPLVPPVVAGRLPMTVGAFDVAVVRADAIRAVPAHYDPREPLRPGGVLCLLGAVRPESIRLMGRLMRKAVGDQITVNAPVALDDPECLREAGAIRHMLLSTARVDTADAGDVGFLPAHPARHDPLSDLCRRIGVQPPGPIAGTLLVVNRR